MPLTPAGGPSWTGPGATCGCLSPSEALAGHGEATSKASLIRSERAGCSPAQLESSVLSEWLLSRRFEPHWVNVLPWTTGVPYIKLVGDFKAPLSV